MMRSFYRWLLRFHPRHFRERFAQEMLYGFDETRSGPARLWLVTDAAVSLIRQWFFRPKNWVAPRRSLGVAPGGVPLFAVLDEARPNSCCLMCGLAVSAAVFVGIVAVSSGRAVSFKAGLLPPFPNSFSGLFETRMQAGPFVTPAGRRLAEWIHAYNTGEAARMRRFASLHLSKKPLQFRSVVLEQSVQSWMEQFHENGPFKTSILVDESEPNRMVVRAQSTSGAWSRIVVQITGSELKAETDLIVESIR